MQPPEQSGPGRGGETGWRSPYWFALLLGLVCLAVFPGVVLGWETFRYRDFGFFSFPVAQVVRDSLVRFELPFWTPLSNCGIPFLAQWSHLGLYPPALAYLLLPASWSVGLLAVIHLYVAGLGMFFLARRWSGDGLGAALAGVVFAFNGLTLNCLMWPHYMAVIAWLPWVLWLVERGWREGGRTLGWSVVVATLQMLAGTPEFILFTWLLLVLMAGVTAWTEPLLRKRLAGRFVLQVGLVSLLSAPQILPFLDLLAQSQRDSGFAATETWALAPTGWANFLVPQFRCYLNKDGTLSQYGQYFTNSFYCGLPALVLALVAVRSRQPQVRALVVAAVLGAALALGESGGVYPLLLKWFPVAGVMRYPSKFLLVPVVCIPILAAVGVGVLRANGARGRWAACALILVVLGVAGVMAYARMFPLGDENWPMVLQSGWSRLGLLGAAAGVFVLMVWWRGSPRLQRLLTVLFLVVGSVDLLTHLPQRTPTGPRALYDPAPPRLLDTPPTEVGRSRVMISAEADLFFKYLISAEPVADYALSRRMGFSNCNLMNNQAKVDGFFPLYLRDQARLMDWLYSGTNRPPAGLLDFLGVTHITAPRSIRRWEARSTALPWITVGALPRRSTDPEEAFRVITSSAFDPRRVVHIAPGEDGIRLPEQASPEARVSESRFTSGTVRARVTSPRPTMMVVAQSYARGWRATVNGDSVPLLRANHEFQAVVVPAGESWVELEYRERSFAPGCFLALVGVLVTGGVMRRNGPGIPRAS